MVPLTEDIVRSGGLFRRDYGLTHGTGLVDGLIAATAEHVNARLVTLNRRHYPMFDEVVWDPPENRQGLVPSNIIGMWSGWPVELPPLFAPPCRLNVFFSGLRRYRSRLLQQVMDSLYIIGIAFTLFFAVLLFNKPQQGLADRILCGLLLLILAHLLDYYLEHIGLVAVYPHLKGLADGFAFMYGPFLYCYIRCLVEPTRGLRRNDLVHLLPIAGYTLIYLPFFLTDAAHKIERYEQGITSVPYVLEIAIGIKILSMPFYLILIFSRLRQHGVATEQYYANTESVDLQWLRNLALGMGAFWLFMVSTLLADALWGFSMPGRADELIFAALVAAVIALGYFGFRQGSMFGGTAAAEEPSPRYERSGLREEEAAACIERLQSLMENDKPYLSCDLTIEDVSRSLGIPRHHLTQVLNEHLGRNFYLFVNEYRVAEARRRIADPATGHLTLLAIGLESGFNSKSSFNAAFKRLTSMTPSQFRRSCTTDVDGIQPA
mgnify:CR=1 FL=1